MTATSSAGEKRRVPSYSEGVADSATRQRLLHLTAPHVESFDYFLSTGMHAAVSDVSPLEMRIESATPNPPTAPNPPKPSSSSLPSSSSSSASSKPLFVRLLFTSIRVGVPLKGDDGVELPLTPREARERGLNYAGQMFAGVTVLVNDSQEMRFEVSLGDFPIMVLSERCHLKNLSPNELIALREEGNELGGYFIVNGIERIIRLLQVPRRNFATAIERSSFRNRGTDYSDKGVAMRCARRDQSSITITLHYLTSGNITLRMVVRKQEFLLPVMLIAKALMPISDREIFDRVLQKDVSNTFASARLELLLRDFKAQFSSLHSCEDCRAYLGRHFRIFLPISDRTTDVQAGTMLIDKYIFVHCESYAAKLEVLLFMMRKLLAFAQGNCLNDNTDALMNHELLLPGHLLSMLLRERLEEILGAVRGAFLKDSRLNKDKLLLDITTEKYVKRVFDRVAGGVGAKVRSFLSTGNLVTTTGMDLMQVSGFTVVAERLNIFRYLSHFQSVHRGQFFTTMKTTAVRKLLPESWGFLCPVHTPDGSPCGLLNHMALEAVLIAFPTSDRLPFTSQGRLTYASSSSSSGKKKSTWLTDGALKKFLVSLGVVPSTVGGQDGQAILSNDHLPVLLDGVVLGGIRRHQANNFVSTLRRLKVGGSEEGTSNERWIDPTMEIAYLPPSPHKTAFPGIYLFTSPGRMIRATRQLASGGIEWIGPMEQVFLNIACLQEDVRVGETTHAELSPAVMLSHVAALTPFSDYNQSPRNMYQCQMGKQTMGTPAHALKSRSDNKLYRIQSPQAPLVQTAVYADYAMDEYSQGTNAVVAVISYTGYDMEDAMIINKGSYERGFGHGSMYKTAEIDLEVEEKSSARDGVKPSLRFSNIIKTDNTDQKGAIVYVKFQETLDVDGLPEEGMIIEYGDPICCLLDDNTGQHRLIKHKEIETAFVDTVRILGTNSTLKKPSFRAVSITLRYRRNPIIGDKFSSRHGQKGTLSVLWPQENMPFSESGLCPDVLINPHAFPSRMTIGMLIESMAGKSGAMHGVYQDATPFQFHEKQKVIDHIGEQLLAAGYSYHGSEPLYSGVSGREMQVDIFIGLVYYQRLRHMVSDKSQVRSTGPVMAVTRQPVKGRKRHGGIRLGEMERDALLSHGVSFCLQDRLMNCSDSHLAFVCANCGSLLTVQADAARDSLLTAGTQQILNGGVRGGGAGGAGVKQTCKQCSSGKHVKAIYLPYVYRYLTNELAGMGIKLSLTLQ